MWKTIQALFERISVQVENNPTPFVRYLQLFFAILTLRLTLEFFSSQRLFTLDDILHIGLWFMFIVLAFLLQLHFFSGEKILRISKLVITFFSIALTAPIIDMLIFQGKGAKMNYLSLHTWEQVVYSYCTVGGASFSRGATPGIRVEIILLLMACFNYVYIKRKSVFWSILSVWSIYTVLFISGAIPALLGILVNTFHLQYQSDDQSTLLLLLTVNLFLLLIAVQRYSPTRFSQIWGSVPWISMLMALVYGGVGAPSHFLPSARHHASNSGNGFTCSPLRPSRLAPGFPPAGVEMGGALKNIVAIASGIARGLGYGDNTTAAIITRGLNEMIRFGAKLGADPRTLYGLSGLGDLVVTCGSRHSRNHQAGFLIGQGKTPQTALEKTGMVVEGFYTTQVVYELARTLNVEMPIVRACYYILYGNHPPADEVELLMTRRKKHEIEEVVDNVNGW